MDVGTIRAVRAAGEIADDIERICEVLHDAARSGRTDTVERTFGGIVGAVGDEAVTERFPYQMTAGVVVVGLPVKRVGLGITNLDQEAVGTVDAFDGKTRLRIRSRVDS